MKHNNFGYLIGEGFRAMFKHGFMSFAAVCITVACLVIINSFTLICYNLNLMVEDLQEKMVIRVCIDDSYTRAEAMSVGSDINLIANVEEATFVSNEDALESYKERFDQDSYFEDLEAKYFRHQYIVTLVDNARVAETEHDLKKVPGIADIFADTEVANAMATIRTVLYIVALGITAVLLIVSLIIISNTIRLAMQDRKEEIGIMKVVGATNSFIRFPFVIEGFLLGLFGSVFSFFIEWGLYEAIRLAIADTGTKVISIQPFSEVMVPMAIVCGISGFFIGIFGSLMSIRKFLKV